MSDIWTPPIVAVSHPSLFTSAELESFERDILGNPAATEHDASRFFFRFPKFLYLGRGDEIRRRVQGRETLENERKSVMRRVLWQPGCRGCHVQTIPIPPM